MSDPLPVPSDDATDSGMPATRPDASRSRPRWLGLLGWLAASGLAMGFGARNVPGLWFETLEKPFFNPPGWVFAPVWIVLYTQMAIAAWLVWRPDGFRGSARFPLVIYLVQLLFNALWPWLFFGLHRMDWALTDILALFVLLVLLVPAFYREHRTAGWLLLPYVVWIGFATLLNTAFLRMNG